MINELNKIIKIKYNNLKGLNNIEQCIDNCSITYNNNNNAIIKNKQNEYLIDYEYIGIFDISSKTWYWSFGFSFKNNNKTIIAKSIRKNMINIIKTQEMHVGITPEQIKEELGYISASTILQNQLEIWQNRR
jgi:hypothetical protein